MDIKLFQQKLNDICAIAEENNKQLSQQQIRDHFDESDLSTSQLVKILQYLKLKGITIEGADEGTGAARADAVSSESGDKEELPGTRAALTAEEQAYLSDYMESFSPEGLDPDDLASLFQAFAKGDTAAEGALTQFYMAQAAQMAAELNCEEIHLADLIQEANLALLASLKETSMYCSTFSDMKELMYFGRKASPLSEYSGWMPAPANLSTVLPLWNPKVWKMSNGASVDRQFRFMIPVCLITWWE